MSQSIDVGRIGCASVTRPRDDIELRRMRAERFVDGKDVLDIGAGTGRLSLLVARTARSVVGIDPDDEAIREADRAARSSGVRNARFMVGPAQQLPVPDGSFDTALFSWSL
jgi:ubiquinone/menaquinone biosynthesis C-methylase UbiE